MAALFTCHFCWRPWLGRCLMLSSVTQAGLQLQVFKNGGWNKLQVSKSGWRYICCYLPPCIPTHHGCLMHPASIWNYGCTRPQKLTLGVHELNKTSGWTASITPALAGQLLFTLGQINKMFNPFLTLLLLYFSIWKSYVKWYNPPNFYMALS